MSVPGPLSRAWLEVATEPCPWCGVWIGRHFHRTLEDGNIGIVVVSDEPAEYVPQGRWWLKREGRST